MINELSTIRSMDVVLPVKDRPEVRLRLVAKPDELARTLLAHIGLYLPKRPRMIENVVEKN